MTHLTLREAVVARRLVAFVEQQQTKGAELVTGSELERGLALLITQRRVRWAGINGERRLSADAPWHLLIRL